MSKREKEIYELLSQEFLNIAGRMAVEIQEEEKKEKNPFVDLIKIKLAIAFRNISEEFKNKYSK